MEQVTQETTEIVTIDTAMTEEDFDRKTVISGILNEMPDAQQAKNAIMRLLYAEKEELCFRWNMAFYSKQKPKSERQLLIEHLAKVAGEKEETYRKANAKKIKTELDKQGLGKESLFAALTEIEYCGGYTKEQLKGACHVTIIDLFQECLEQPQKSATGGGRKSVRTRKNNKYEPVNGKTPPQVFRELIMENKHTRKAVYKAMKEVWPHIKDTYLNGLFYAGQRNAWKDGVAEKGPDNIWRFVEIKNN